MRMIFVKITELIPSKIEIGTFYRYLHFQDLDGRLYRLTLSPHWKHYKQWEKLINAGVGVIVDNLEVVKFRVIGSYPKPKLISRLKM